MSRLDSSKRASRAPVRRVRRPGITPARTLFAARSGAISGGRRSATERPVDPRPATVPHPHPSLGDTRVSRPVAGQETRLGDREDGCRGWILGCRESQEGLPGGGARAGLGETPRGFSPEGPARTGALPLSDTGATPARQRRAPARMDSFGRLGGSLERSDFAIAPVMTRAWRSRCPEAPEPPTPSNLCRKKPRQTAPDKSQPSDGCVRPRKHLIAKTTHPTSEITSGISP